MVLVCFGAFRGDLGASLGPPGVFLGPLGASWGALGGILGPLGGVLGALGRLLGRLETMRNITCKTNDVKIEKGGRRVLFLEGVWEPKIDQNRHPKRDKI